jgi:uncharacterized repeat protein (TIGR03803 family)
MQVNRTSLGLRITFVILTVSLLAANCVATEKVLHNFGISGNDGQRPGAGLIFDSAGNLYGTTVGGGSKGAGTAFETSPNGSGSWTTKVLHNFGISKDEGTNPEAGLIFDGAGNLYGTTFYGGSEGYGTVFELTPNGSGGWTEKVLHNFGNDGGARPQAGLIFDTSGNLYGTTTRGGSADWGTVFELTPNGSGGWTERVLHNFDIADGVVPTAPLIFDGSGNLYGTTDYGGSGSGCAQGPGCGTVFEMTPNGSGGWTERVIHNFGIGGDDGQFPSAGLTLDSAGDLYGTTYAGGSKGDGTVFEMTPNGSGGWTERAIHNFGIGENDGAEPEAGLIFDSAGYLYGTTYAGGSKGGGTVFELTPNGSGGWTEGVIHNFGIGENDGVGPEAELIFDGAGNLYGTTFFGGSEGDGTVFEVMP